MTPITHDRYASHRQHGLRGVEVQYAQHARNHSCTRTLECELSAQTSADDRHRRHGDISGRDVRVRPQESNEVPWNNMLGEGVVCVTA